MNRGRGGPPAKPGFRGGMGKPRAPFGKGAPFGAKAPPKVVVEPHRHAGVFVSRGKDMQLLTKNMVPGESVYGEKRIQVDSETGGDKIEYRVWNPFRSKLGAMIVGGIGEMPIKQESPVASLNSRSTTSPSSSTSRRALP